MSFSESTTNRGFVQAIVALLCVTAVHAGTIVHVDQNATGAIHDGSDWCDAFVSLQDALAVAASGTINEIRVANGIYRPADPNGDREATFQLIDNVQLLGGYAGCGAPDPDARDVTANETVLSGDLNADDGLDFANNEENSYHVVTSGKSDDTAVLDGFTITAGNANGTFPHHQGAGIHNVLGNAPFANCTIGANSALLNGGGMYNLNGNPTVTDCVFSENRVTSFSGISGGGGMYNSEASPVLTRCTFDRNTAPSYGGGMENTSNSSPTLHNCTFTGNTATVGGGINNFLNHAAPALTDCTFIGNSAANRGGAVDAFDGNPTFMRCVFSGNTAGELGGAFSSDDTVSPTFTECTFNGNTSGRDAGAMHLLTAGTPRVIRCTFTGNSTSRFGGAVQSAAHGLIMNDCVFSGNSAGSGGAIMGWTTGTPDIINCTLTGNTAVDAAGGIYLIGLGNPTLTNCILWNNNDSGANRENAQIQLKGTGSPSATYSVIEGLNAVVGKGNIDQDPRFLDSVGADGIPGNADDDLRLAPDSPCINTGDPAFAPAPGAADLDGHARVLCNRVDMGAHEYGIGDFDCDRDVDLLDFAQRPPCVTGPTNAPFAETCEPFDFDGDLDVDFRDFAGFQRVFNGP